jgi:hypothetical protein
MQKHSPQFIGIGAAHAGLGIVTKLLSSHPQVVTAIPALNFFNTDAFVTRGTLAYEDELLPAYQSGKLRGECSPAYLAAPGVAERIATEYPDTKLFVIVRNPIDRSIAHYEQAKRKKAVSPHISCARYMAATPAVQTDGFYGKHLHEYFFYYTSKQLHIIVYEDLVTSPLTVMQTLFAFLEINPNFIPKELASFAPPPDEPKHRGRISRLVHFIAKLIKKARTKPAAPIFPEAFVHTKYCTAEELVPFKRVFATDARHLTNLLHRDMGVFWNLDEEPVP